MIIFFHSEFNFDLILCHIQSEICFEVCIFFLDLILLKTNFSNKSKSTTKKVEYKGGIVKYKEEL